MGADPSDSSRAISRLARIHIKNLRLRTFIGFNEEERRKRQDVVINLSIQYNARAAAAEDTVQRALDYKTINKEVIALVEGNRFLLLEHLAHEIIDAALAHEQVLRVDVEVDKPHALRFSDSVSMTMTGHRTAPDDSTS